MRKNIKPKFSRELFVGVCLVSAFIVVAAIMIFTHPKGETETVTNLEQDVADSEILFDYSLGLAEENSPTVDASSDGEVKSEEIIAETKVTTPVAGPELSGPTVAEAFLR